MTIGLITKGSQLKACIVGNTELIGADRAQHAFAHHALRQGASFLRSKGNCPFHDLHSMTADPHVLYTVSIFTGAHENVARAFDLYAL